MKTIKKTPLGLVIPEYMTGKKLRKAIAKLPIRPISFRTMFINEIKVNHPEILPSC